MSRVEGITSAYDIDTFSHVCRVSGVLHTEGLGIVVFRRRTNPEDVCLYCQAAAVGWFPLRSLLRRLVRQLNWCYCCCCCMSRLQNSSGSGSRIFLHSSVLVVWEY